MARLGVSGAGKSAAVIGGPKWNSVNMKLEPRRGTVTPQPCATVLILRPAVVHQYLRNKIPRHLQAGSNAEFTPKIASAVPYFRYGSYTV